MIGWTRRAREDREHAYRYANRTPAQRDADRIRALRAEMLRLQRKVRRKQQWRRLLKWLGLGPDPIPAARTVRR